MIFYKEIYIWSALNVSTCSLALKCVTEAEFIQNIETVNNFDLLQFRTIIHYGILGTHTG